MHSPTCLTVIALTSWLVPVSQHASKAPDDATVFCPDIQFSAYSTVEPGGQRLAESIHWDGQQQSYVIRGPALARMLNYPGAAEIPRVTSDAQATFTIAIGKSMASPADRFCEANFQESAECTTHREVLYTQLYTDCDLQTYRHVVRIGADQAGKLPLLVLSFADVRGQFGPPLYLAAGSDLRLR